MTVCVCVFGFVSSCVCLFKLMVYLCLAVSGCVYSVYVYVCVSALNVAGVPRFMSWTSFGLWMNESMNGCVCVYVCMYVYGYVWIYICVYMWMYFYVDLSLHNTSLTF